MEENGRLEEPDEAWTRSSGPTRTGMTWLKVKVVPAFMGCGLKGGGRVGRGADRWGNWVRELTLGGGAAAVKSLVEVLLEVVIGLVGL